MEVRTKLPEADLVAAIGDFDALIVRSETKVTEAVLAAGRRLRVVGRAGVGVDNVDVAAATRRGILVVNAPRGNIVAAAEHTVALLFALARNIPQADASVRRGEWQRSRYAGVEVRGKTLGIVGYGHIGTQIGVLAEQLGMSVVFHDIEAKLPLGNARQLPVLDALLAAADVVSLHVPETPETRNLIGAAQLARMKPGSHLINASRGTVVDIDALTAALESGHLQGAAIDVFPVEPQGNDTGFDSPLTRFDNVILTPHIGGSTAEAQANIGREVAAKLIRYSNNGSTASAVNFPEVTLPEHTGRCRLLHIHKNVPGVLARVNERFSAAGINIDAQYLRTNEEVGYAVIDVDTTASQVALEELCAVPDTIRCRILY